MAATTSQTTPPLALDNVKNQIDNALRLINSSENTSEDIQKLYEEMHSQDHRHKNVMDEIHALQHTLYTEGVYEGLEEQIAKQASEQMEATIREQVEEELKKYISREQQEQVADINKEMKQVMIDLHNSESRHANSLLQSDGSNRVLSTIQMSNGAVSEHFPRTLNNLFELKEDAIEKLMTDYQFCVPEDSLFLRLNKFVQFCGVRYQMVSPFPVSMITGTYRDSQQIVAAP